MSLLHQTISNASRQWISSLVSNDLMFSAVSLDGCVRLALVVPHPF